MNRKGGLGQFNPLFDDTEKSKSAGTPSDLTASSPAHQPTSRSAKPQSDDEELVKAAFYFSQEELDRLEEVWQKLRRIQRWQKRTISKSLLVRIAFRQLADTIENDPEEWLA